MNGTSVPRMTWRHMIIVRAAPVPSITTVWTGIRAAGGITIAISASSSTPPAAPVKTPMKPETNDATERPANRSGPISGVKRKSMRAAYREFHRARQCMETLRLHAFGA